ncbi:MAG: PIN domain-containing protein [Candidatus Aenigmarchaeota archaeon]|nr:PIN domain-containing protein [Candidatus Aenigmarchaeota archaeon]
MKILLDTNFLMAVAQFKADVFGELQGNDLFTLSSCIQELEKLAGSRKKDAPAARVALELLQKKGVKIIEASGNTDFSLMEKAEKGYAVATNDAALIKKLKESGIKVLRLKQKKRIFIE